jgi:hypothetical protein
MPPIRRSSEGSTRRSEFNETESRIGTRTPFAERFDEFLRGECEVNASSSVSFGLVCVDDCEDDDDNVNISNSENSELVSVKSSHLVCVDGDSVT